MFHVKHYVVNMVLYICETYRNFFSEMCSFNNSFFNMELWGFAVTENIN